MNRRTWFLSLCALALCACLVAPGAGPAAIITINGPFDVVPGSGGQTYVNYTTLMPITVPDFTNFTSVSAGGVTATFSGPLNARTAPGGGWATWSSQPDSERPASGTIRVGFHQSAAPLTINLSSGVDVFGFEAEPNQFQTFTFTAQYFSGATSLGSITRTVNGSAGARLFAGVEPGGNLIDRVVVTSTDVTGFAAGQFRFHQGGVQVVPEPTSLALVGLGGLSLAGYNTWRRRRAQPA